MSSDSSVQCVYRNSAGQVITSASGLKPSRVIFDQSKKGYRLPTEAEWEYAARFHGTDSTNSEKYGYEYLLSTDQLSGEAWCWGNTGGKTQPVGQKVPNYAGIYDMSGNVWEWCYDGCNSNVPTGVQTDPTGSASVGARVLRGGCWDIGAFNCVVGCRNSRDANNVSYWWYGADIGYILGFRLAYSW